MSTTAKIKDLTPYARNSRTHSDEQVAQIAASIREFGFTAPVLYADGTVIAGHGRLMAAQRLQAAGHRIALPSGELLPDGMVPAIDCTGWTDAQKRAYVIADNKLALNAGWDDDMLRLELGELKDDGFDLDVVGFSAEELGALFDAAEIEELPPDADPDACPEVQPDPVSKQGDVWLLGRHRVMCGDSTSIDDVERLCDGAAVDLWLTDPPYNVAYTGKTADALTIKNDKMEDGNFRQFLRDAYSAADAVMRPGAVFYVWHADTEVVNFRGACQDVGWRVRECLIWVKNVLVLGRQDYHWRHEPCLYGWKDGAAHTWTSDRKQTTVLEFNKPQRNGEHPTMKPVDLIEYQVGNSTTPGQTVLDSFGGSGTTLIACEKLGRKARLMELDPKYVDVIVRRWQTLTGKTATLEATGQTFAEAEADGASLDA